MIIPSRIEQYYNDWKPFFKNVEDRVEGTLIPFCRREGFIYEGRIKTLESLAEKIESGRYSSWENLDDFYACTIAIPLFEHEQQVIEFLKSRFKINSIKRRGSIPKPPDVFRFDSTRILAQIRVPPETPIERGPSIHKVTFEIQVKSLFDLAWTKTTHALTYKSGMVDWKRYRLTAHLKATAEQADFLLSGFEQASKWLIDGQYPDIDDKAFLYSFFQGLVETKRIPSESIPKDWSRFVDNVYNALQAFTGVKPSGRSSQKLKIIKAGCDILNEYFAKTDYKMVPRSLSLFQIVIGILSSSGQFEGAWGQYYIHIDESFEAIFPNVVLPGSCFSSSTC